MRFRTTWLLVILCAVLGALYWHFSARSAFYQERRAQWSTAFHMDPDRIVYLRVEWDDRIIECVVDRGVWRIVEPIRTRANAGELDRLMTRLGSLSPGEIITEWDRRVAQLTLADYGLDRPRGRLIWNDGARRHEWLLGRVSPVGDSVYVMEQGKSDIISVSAHLIEWIPSSVTPLRDPVLVHGDPGRTTRLDIRRAGGFLQLTQDRDGVWRLQQPIAARADRQAVIRLLEKLFAIRITDFVADNVSDMTAYGLDASAVQVSLWTDQQEAGVSFILGLPVEGGASRIHARRQDGESVFAIERSIWDAVSIRANDLRDRDLIPWTTRDVSRVTLTQEGQSIVLERDTEDAWHIRHPRFLPADEQEVQQLVEAWMAVTIERYPDDGMTNIVAMVATNAAASIVFERNGQIPDPARRSVILSFADAAPTSTWMAVHSSLDQLTVDIGRGAWDATKWQVMDYRKRDILNLRVSEIRRLGLRRADGTEQIVMRDETGQWQPVGGVGAIRVTDLLPDILQNLTRLRVDRFVVKEEGSSSSDYGLENPVAVLSIGLSGEAGIGQALILGDVLADGSVYARTRGQEDVFVLSAETTRHVLTDLHIPTNTVHEPVLDMAPSESGE